ncbi:short-chain dehydrogenase [Pseudomonas alcaligenes]|uniref:Short-chain dehydrogenase n=1 Tax=Aquipseudomonas alcaligenes TaxID=43263 RepID=A0ABR7S3L1_AQUAC|nr:SDR family oxidoreductase [Pseudomonas alcaligenes]MBC9251659.1 short-chain dehydrogenase [Pseudomonas alcaligenes]
MQNILITGASRGIGLGLAETYLNAGAQVHAVVRNPDSAELRQLQARFAEHLQLIVCNLNDTEAGARILAQLAAPALDAVILNAGVYGPTHQDIAQASTHEINELFLSNAIAPLRLARQLAPRVGSGGVIAFMSSQMASVELARAAQMPLYGASKAALNSLIRSWSQATDSPAATLLALHPGWVRTAMGGDQAPLEVADSAAGLQRSIAHYAGQGGCHFIDYQQQVLPW